MDEAGPLETRIRRGEVTLPGRDGRDWRIRPIRPSDAPSLIRGYAALSDEAKRFRMLHTVPALSEAMAARFCAPDPATEVCLVIEGKDDLAGEICGGARIGGTGPGRAAEFSVSLRPELRGLGLARGALETVIEVARERGCASVWGTISARNVAMLRLADRIGFEIRRDPDDYALRHAEIALGTG